MTPLWTKIPCHTDSGEIEHAMNVLGKTLRSGPFGTKKPNKKHMTSCIITYIHWGGHSWYRMRMGLVQRRRMKKLAFPQDLASQSGECHVRHGRSGGHGSAHCFSAGRGPGSNLRLFQSPLALHVSTNTY